MKIQVLIELVRMALKNLTRHRVKTIITIAAVAISVGLYIFIDGWLAGMNIESQRNIVAFETGAAKLQTKEYYEIKDELPMYESFSHWEPIAEVLEQNGYAVAPRFVFNGTLFSSSGSAPIVFYAIDPERESSVLRYPNYIDLGRFPNKGSFEIVLGYMAAEKLRIGIPRILSPERLEEDLLSLAITKEEENKIRGLYRLSENSDEKRFILRSDAKKDDLQFLWNRLFEAGQMRVRIATVIDIKTETGAIRHINQIIDVQVVGVINCPNPQLNANVACIPLDVLQDEAGMMLQGHITELIIRSKNTRDDRLPGPQEHPEQIQSCLLKGIEQKGLPIPSNLVVYGWKSYVSDYIAVSTGDNISNRIIIILLFIISFIGISNTMLMAVLERTKETGMLRSLGMIDSEILLVYIIEASLIGFLGSCFGIVLGCLINIPMVLYGIDYSAMVREMEGDFGYRIVGLFRSTWNWPVIFGIGPVATSISGLGALFPTIRALKLPVTDSLRFE